MVCLKCGLDILILCECLYLLIWLWCCLFYGFALCEFGFDCCGYCDLFVDGCGVLRLVWSGLVVYAVTLIGCLV